MVNVKRLSLGVTLFTLLVFAAVFARWAWWGRSIPRDTILLPQLVVLAYDSFTAPLGPAGALIQDFEKTCRCQVRVITAGDSGLLLEKLNLLKDSTKVDVVMGLDQLSLASARKNQSWHTLNIKNRAWDPRIKQWLNAEFVPFDWAPLTFIYRQGEVDPPHSAKDLAQPNLTQTIALQDPRTSSPGLQLLFSLQTWFGDNQLPGFLKKFKNNIHSVSPSWSTAYGLFQRRQAKMAFSYLTSLVYHWTVEKDGRYQAVQFREGHPVQVEYVGVPSECKNCELAQRFVEHLLKPESQRVLMEKNFMFPVIHSVQKGTVFEDLPKLELFDSKVQESFEYSRPALIESWQKFLQ